MAKLATSSKRVNLLMPITAKIKIIKKRHSYFGWYCIKGNVNVCLIFPNLPNGFKTGTIKTLSLIIFVGMLEQAMFVFRLSNTAVYLSNSLAQQMSTYVI